MEQLQDQLSKYLANTDPETMLKTWFPESVKGLGQLQEHFWRQFTAGMAGGDSSDSSDKS